MLSYKTPGVHVEEISLFPPSVVPVATAIPAFIGYTEKAEDENGIPLAFVPTRITSLLKYREYFGEAKIKEFLVDVTEKNGAITVRFNPDPELPEYFLYYSMQLFFANGGGPCYVVSIGTYTDAPAKADFTDPAGPGAIEILESYDEPTLLVFPDSCLLNNNQIHADVVSAALAHCNKMQDRFTIADVRDAVVGGTVDNSEVNADFRNRIPSDLSQVKYGAAYFPYLHTSLAFHTKDANIKVASHTVDGGAGTIPANTAIEAVNDSANTAFYNTAVYNAVKAFIASSPKAMVTVPPSGAVAGAYARVDRDRGVWKAPANVSLSNVMEPVIKITNDLNDDLNIDATSGKSVNAIRAFAGKGTLIWGSRTLAGNDNENRYVPVRRFLIFAEESIKKATAAFVFEPNDANTWVKVRSMIESFLTRQWRDGALAGAKPEHAFYVSVGLNQTMSAQDILDGYMIVEIGLAIVRPAEFIVLRFAQKMQES